MKLSHCLQSTVQASVVAFAVLAMPVQAATQFLQVVNVGADDALNLRAAPGASSTVIGKIPSNGQTIVATGRKQGSWVQVDWAGQTGWVNKRFLQTSGQARAATRPTSPAVTVALPTHTHAANPCTRSVTHSHANGAEAHEHHYACKQGENQSGVKPKFAPKFNHMPKVNIDIKY